MLYGKRRSNRARACTNGDTTHIFVGGNGMEQEVWKPIPGYEGLYDVSTFGNVRTIKRQGTNSRVLKQKLSKKGYFTVSLCKHSKYKTVGVHRLVASAFIPNINCYPCINHKDENKKNNVVNNLEWCTYEYNNNYGTARERAAKTRYKPCIGTWPDGTKRKYNSCTIASKETGIAQGNIWGACNGLWNTAGGVKWDYV